MVCPECGSIEITKDPEGQFCKKCGLELGEIVIDNKGRKKCQVVQIPKIEVIIDPRKELDALVLGLRNNKLVDKWENVLGFKLNSGKLSSELKQKALILIKQAYKKNESLLEESKSKIESRWADVNNKFFFGTEDTMDFKWLILNHRCYLTLSTKYGFHNSIKNHIIIQQSLGKISNYVIAHELFHIIYRNYVTRFFKEKFTEEDKQLSKIIVTFMLLGNDLIKSCFPDMKFSFDIYHKQEHKDLAKKLWPLWEKRTSFKEFMINSYKAIGVEKLWVSY
jgi:transcription initiation factor TFIIIB Brf1 subunit/transcription initiation factor TFIIB